MSTDHTFFTNDMSSGALQTPYESKVEVMLYGNHIYRQKGLMISILIELTIDWPYGRSD